MSVPDVAGKRKRRRKAGDLGALKRVMWRGLEAAEAILDDPDAGVDAVLKAVNALASLGGAYVRAFEISELRSSLEEVERIQGGSRS